MRQQLVQTRTLTSMQQQLLHTRTLTSMRQQLVQTRALTLWQLVQTCLDLYMAAGSSLRLDRHEAAVGFANVACLRSHLSPVL